VRDVSSTLRLSPFGSFGRRPAAAHRRRPEGNALMIAGKSEFSASEFHIIVVDGEDRAMTPGATAAGLDGVRIETATVGSIGGRLRRLRKARGLSLRVLSDAADLSIGFVSQIERGLSTPSVRALSRLADALGVGIGELFPAEDGALDGEARIVARAGQQPEIDIVPDGIVKRWLTPFGRVPRLDIYMMELAPDASSGDRPYVHEGEEAGLVLDGGLELYVDDHRWVLGPGDSFRFASGRPHRFVNAGPRPARVLWVNYRDTGGTAVTPVPAPPPAPSSEETDR
jgi:transcriptional regulator with XRE-family HTH domain